MHVSIRMSAFRQQERGDYVSPAGRTDFGSRPRSQKLPTHATVAGPAFESPSDHAGSQLMGVSLIGVLLVLR
jgi:hypothetical protein